jgi:hypothetical protein
MNIISQFSLTNYTSLSELDLMNIPLAISNDNKKLAEYNRFIDSISTIYGSQTTSGNIPIFWTVPSGYRYAPSPESTLRKLMPKESYYFIVRDESSLPLNIPYVSGLLSEQDDTRLPTVSFSGNKILTDHTYGYMEFIIKDLKPYEDYKFKFNHIHANWPCTINPISGIFKPSEPEYVISAVLEFCDTSTSHSNDQNLLPFILDGHEIDSKNLYNILNIEISSMSNTSDSIMSDSINMHCNECLGIAQNTPTTDVTSSKPTIFIPEVINLISYDKAIVQRDKIQARIDSMYTKLDSLDPSSTNFKFLYNTYDDLIIGLTNDLEEVRDGRFCTFKTKISNLNPSYTYRFNYSSVDGNWPAVVITPPSGSISNESSYEILTTVAFAACSGAYPSNMPGYLNYHNTSKFDKNNVYTMINITVASSDGNPSFRTTSKPLSIYCKDCLNS